MKLQHFITSILSAGILIAIAGASCSRNGYEPAEETHWQRIEPKLRQNSLVAFDNDSIMAGEGAMIAVAGEHIIVEDPKSTSCIFKVFDNKSGRSAGSFGYFGQGPGEIANPGIMTISPDGERIYLIDYGKWQLITVNIDSALINSDYDPVILLNMSDMKEDAFPDRMVMISESVSVGRRIIPYREGGYEQRLCTVDFQTGKMASFGDDNDMISGFRSSVASSVPDSIVVEFSSTNDLIRLYNLAGELKKEIKGPDYNDQPAKNSAFYSNAAIGGGKIYAVYSTDRDKYDFFGRNIEIFDLAGNHIDSWQFDDGICDIEYDPEGQRLLLSTTGDNQFCYLPLTYNGVNTNPSVKTTGLTLSESPSSGTKEGQEAVSRLISLVKPSGMGVEHVATDSSFPFSQTDSTLCYAFDIMNLSDQILEIDKVECSANSSLSVVSRNSLKPGMIVSVNVTTPLLSGNLDGELSIYVKGVSYPVLLKIRLIAP